MGSHLKDLTLLPFPETVPLTTVSQVCEILPENEPVSGPLLH
jgi:hypothetical protein